MGTRSTYRVIETYKNDEDHKERKELFCLYVQYDGYPDGHPLDVAKWLSKGKVVNGFGADDEGTTVFNGAGCLAAQLVCQLKNGTGGAYIQPLGSFGNSWEDYVYDIIVDSDTKKIEMIAYEVGFDSDETKSTPLKVIFEGSPKKYVTKFKKKKS